jgi:predicted nucleotidyltransferase
MAGLRSIAIAAVGTSEAQHGHPGKQLMRPWTRNRYVCLPLALQLTHNAYICVAHLFIPRSGLWRGETEMDSDIDLAAEFDPAARMDLLRLSAVERRIAELLGSPVDLLPEPVEKRRLQDQINRDRRRAF